MEIYRRNQKNKKEWTSNLYAGKGDDLEPCIAEWADGYTAQITDLFNKDLHLKGKAQASRKQKNDNWSGEKDGMRLKICFKKDRSPLWALMEKNKQLVGFRVDWFKSSDEAYSELVVVAKQYANGDFEKEKFKEIRDAKAKESEKASADDGGVASSSSGTSAARADAAGAAGAASLASSPPPSKRTRVASKRPAAAASEHGVRKRPAAATIEVAKKAEIEAIVDDDPVPVARVPEACAEFAMFDMADCMYG